MKTEVMGDLVIKCDDGSIDVKDHWSRWSDKVRILHFEDLHVPVIPLEWQLVANTLLAAARSASTASSATSASTASTRAYLRSLLEDETARRADDRGRARGDAP